MAVIQYAGEYIIDECILCTVGGLEIDMTDLVSSINVYEDIFQNAISGDISFADTNNILGNARIVGQEKLKLKISTPQEGDPDDRNLTINFTSSPLQIYKINSKVNVNDRTVAFNLSFTTPELIRNGNVRVQKSYEGEPADKMIKDVFRDEELLASKKEFYYEETSNFFKICGANQRPFQFINSLARRCLSKEYNDAPTFLFYETVKGYFFRTLDSMMDRKNPKMVFRELTPNANQESRERVDLNLMNILHYDVVSTTDTISSARSGLYGSKLLLLDIVNKDYKEYDYNYLESFDDDKHVDEFNAYGSERAPIASEQIDDYNKKISEYPDGVLHVQMIDRDTPDGLYNPAYSGASQQIDYMGTDKWLQRRKSRIAALNSAVTLRLRVPGNTTLQAGDLIGVNLMKKSSGNDATDLDPTLSGRYLVRKLHHMFTRGEGLYKHEILLECVRDTVSEAFPSNGVACPTSGPSTEEIIPLGSADPGDIIY